MAKYVHEIMNSELFSVEPDAARQDTLEYMLLLGVGGCPVVAADGKLLGFVTLRDLLPEEGDPRVRARISHPGVSIGKDQTIEAAGRKLTKQHAHQLVVLDDAGRAIGIVSAVDIVAALVDEPVTHPSTFLRATAKAGSELVWSSPVALEPENSEAVPNAPGILMLIHSVKGRVDTPVWVEEANNLRARVDDLLSAPQSDQPALAYLLTSAHRRLHFRTTLIDDVAQRSSICKNLQASLKRRVPAGF